MISFAISVNGKSQIQACVFGFYFPDYFLVWMIYYICSFYFNYIIEMECRWFGEVWWSENRLDDSGRKN